MTESPVLTALRDEFAPVRMTVPAGAVMARGRSIQRLRRSRAAAGALAVAIAAGLGVPALTAGGSASHPGGSVALTAWTVSTRPDGTVTATIRQLRDLIALQARLNAAGARVTVTSSASTASLAPSASCAATPGSPAPWPQAVAVRFPADGDFQLLISPARIPLGTVAHIVLTWGEGPGLPGGSALPGVFAFLVHDTAPCAG
jgi:hypothetical protein